MRPSICRSCLACFLKFLNFFQAFAGVSIVIYSVWALNHLGMHHSAGGGAGGGGGGGGGGALGFDLDDLPAPWFVCAAMGAGVLLCLVAFTGHVAAESSSGCCLCFYAVLTIILILLEAAAVGDLVFNKHWEEDLPYDSTGELKSLRAFIEDNFDVFKWVALALVVIQAFSLLLALVLRVMIPTRRVDYDSDEDFVVIRRPLLNPQGEPFPSASVDSKGCRSDIWSSRMRQKYGLNHSEFSYNAMDPKASVSTNSSGDDRKRCSVI